MLDVRSSPPLASLPLLLVALLSVAGCSRFGGASLQEVQTTLSSGDVGTAAVQLQNLLEKNPGSAEVEMLFARVLLLQGDLEGTSSALEKARRLGATPAVAAQLEARLMLEEGRFDELLSRSKSGNLNLDPREESLYVARALTARGRVPEALKILEGLEQPPQGDGRIEVYISQAHAAFGRWALAAKHAELARKAESESPRAWMQSGLLALQRGDTSGAMSYLDRAAVLARDELTVGERSVVLGTMADIALRLEDLAAAKDAYDRLIVLAPQAPVTELLGSRIALASGDVLAAITRLERLIQTHPDAATARLMLVSALLTDGRTERSRQELSRLRTQTDASPAVAQAQEAIETVLRSTDSARTLAIAQAQLLLDQPHAAQLVLEKSLAESADERPLEVALVQVLLRRGQVEAAVKRATELSRKAPDNAAAHLVLGQALVASEDFAAAARSFERAWQIAPTSSNAVSLAMARQAAGHDDPLAPLVEHLTRESHDISALLVLADLQSRRGMPVEAMTTYQTVLSVQPRNPVAANNLAGLYQRRGDPRALASAKAAFEVLPDRPEVTDTYGWILAGIGQAAEAVPLLEKSVRLDPSRPAARYHLAAALARRGQPGDAELARLWLADALRDPADFRDREDAVRLLETMSQTEEV